MTLADIAALLKNGETLAVISGFVVWLIRIEPRMKRMEDSISDLKGGQMNQKKEHDDLAKEIREALSAIRASQARVEGYIAAKREDKNG